MERICCKLCNEAPYRMDLDLGWEENGWGGAIFVQVRCCGRVATALTAIIRNLLSREEESVRMESDGNLAVRIVGGRYKMLYEAGTEHTLRRVMGAAELARLEQKARQRREERRLSRWLE